MKHGLGIILAALALGSVPAAASTYTLTYLDKNHNVCSVGIDDSGQTMGKPAQLTRGGGYDTYSVSPDGKWIAGLADIGGPKYPPSFEWKCFVERAGRGRLKQSFRIESDGEPLLWWSKKGNHLFSWGGQVGGTTRCYDLGAGRKTFETDDTVLDMSEDERYALVLEDVGCCGEGPADLSVADLRSGAIRKLGNIRHESSYCTWLRNSHNCAFIDVSGNVWVAQIGSSGRGIAVSKRRLTRCGHCCDLRISGSSLYFVQSIAGNKRAYRSHDLMSLQPVKVLAPIRVAEARQPKAMDENALPANAWKSCALTTADAKLTACPIDAGHCRMPLIKIFDRSGKAHLVGAGKMPTWSGAGELRRSSYDFLSNYKLDKWQTRGAL